MQPTALQASEGSAAFGSARNQQRKQAICTYGRTGIRSCGLELAFGLGHLSSLEVQQAEEPALREHIKLPLALLPLPLLLQLHKHRQPLPLPPQCMSELAPASIHAIPGFEELPTSLGLVLFWQTQR